MLGVIDVVTLQPIQKMRIKLEEEAIRKVVPVFDELETMRIPVKAEVVKNIFKKKHAADSLIIFKAINKGEFVGAAIETFSDEGFSGRIRLMAGFLPDGTIYKIEVLEHSETPGLGDKMEVGKGKFPDQFLGKNPRDFKLIVQQDDGEVDAITAATITSRAYCDAVDRAYNVFKKVFIDNNEGGKSDE